MSVPKRCNTCIALNNCNKRVVKLANENQKLKEINHNLLEALQEAENFITPLQAQFAPNASKKIHETITRYGINRVEGGV